MELLLACLKIVLGMLYLLSQLTPGFNVLVSSIVAMALGVSHLTLGVLALWVAFGGRSARGRRRRRRRHNR